METRLYTVFDPAIDLTADRTDMAQFARWRDPALVAVRDGQRLAEFRCRPLPTEAAFELLEAVSEPAKAVLAFRACVTEVRHCAFVLDRPGSVVDRLRPASVDGVSDAVWPAYLWTPAEVAKAFPLAVVQDIGSCIVQHGFFGNLYARSQRRAYVLPPYTLRLLDAAFRMAAEILPDATSEAGAAETKAGG